MQEWVRVYHGSINDAFVIRVAGLDLLRLPTWVTRDFAAAQNAVDPSVRADRITNSGIIEARMPRLDFDATLAPHERAYFGFNSLLWGSSEIVLRTSEQAALFNRYIIK